MLPSERYPKKGNEPTSGEKQKKKSLWPSEVLTHYKLNDRLDEDDINAQSVFHGE